MKLNEFYKNIRIIFGVIPRECCGEIPAVIRAFRYGIDSYRVVCINCYKYELNIGRRNTIICWNKANEVKE
jgi:hypothetical protein